MNKKKNFLPPSLPPSEKKRFIYSQLTKMSVKCTRALPSLAGVFSAIEVPADKRTASALVKIALARKYTTLDQVRDLVNEDAPFQAMEDQPDEIEFDTREASGTVEQIAVRLSITRAGATGVVFKRDHVEYGMLKADDGRLVLFVPPDTVRSMTLMGIGAEDFPFPAHDLCEYTCYSPSPLALSDFKEVEAEDTGKGKEEAADWGLVSKTTATVPAVMVPPPPQVPVVHAAVAAVAPASLAKPPVADKPSVADKVPVPDKRSVPANLAVTSLLPSDDDDEGEEGSVKEEKPTPPTKKRPVREKRESSADHSEEKRSKAGAAKKPALSAKPTATITGKTAEAAASAATAAVHAKIQTRK
jgi:hypothetical protein